VEISPILLATAGEIVLIFLVLLIYSIRQAILARRSLRVKNEEHAELLDQHTNINEQKDALEQQQKAVIDLMRETIALIHEQYKQSGHEDLENTESDSFDHNAETASLILAYQVLVAQLNSIENNKEAEEAWHNINEHLQPIIGNLFEKHDTPVSNEEDADTPNTPEEWQEKIDELSAYITELEEAAASTRESGQESHLATLEELEEKIAEQNILITDLKQNGPGGPTFAEAEQFCNAINEYVTGNSIDDIEGITKEFMEMLSQNRPESAEDSDTPQTTSPGTDLLQQGLKNTQNEIGELVNKISNQHETIRNLELKLAKDSASEGGDEDVQMYTDALKQNLKDSEMCIETMELEITTAHDQIAQLKNELEQLADQAQLGDKRSELLDNFASESKQMLDCITVLEDTSDSQQAEIAALMEKLEISEAEKQVLIEQISSPQPNAPPEQASTPEGDE